MSTMVKDPQTTQQTNSSNHAKFPGLIASKPANFKPTLEDIDREIAEYERDPENYDKNKRLRSMGATVGTGMGPSNPANFEAEGKDPNSAQAGQGPEYGYSRQSLGLPEYIFPGICMSDIARDLGMTLGGISRIMNGKRKARLYVLKSIANLYTDGNVAEVKRIIKDRVLKILQYDRKITPEERNKVLERISG